MAKRKIFISSVQTEFSQERKALHEYICADPLLGKFFEPFLFELLPAIDQRADALYLNEVEQSDIYMGIFGKEYGSENEVGISPTEMEFLHATELHKTRFVFLTDHKTHERHPKVNQLINKAQEVLIRKKFNTVDELKSAVYAALVRYLEEKEIIRTGPFDVSFHEKATLDDIDNEKVIRFVRIAQLKRGFPLSEAEPKEKILTHLNLYAEGRITNATLLLFGKEPQRFFINSEVRCASFAGTVVEKPIPSYKVFKGTLFELADQALEFVLTKLDYRIETRVEQISIPGSYEIPKDAVAEAIVNAIAHRDYTSNASVQVMVFRDRIEIWNPGALPMGWTTEKLKQLHTSVPANPLLAEPLYLAGYIERLGTGTTDIVDKCLTAGLLEPRFIQAEDFKTILYRSGADQAPTKHRPSTDQVKALIRLMENEHSRNDLMQLLGLKHGQTFRDNYLNPALIEMLIEMTQPESPNSPTQKYRLTAKGKALKEILKKKK
ncbi:Fic family protein [Candidatus Kuenenia sp.]|uniref:Fic family protein n=1 Tax=Candidatus Kuenenia sp. TaxID=2499824 RepID=UPI0032201B19